MNYEGCQTLEELIGDSTAIEFRENIEYMPFDLIRDQFLEWLDIEALPNWGDEYKPMLQALSRLVSEADYTLAMAQLKALQTHLNPPEAEDELGEPEELEELEAPEEIPTPEDAARRVAEVIVAPIIEEFEREYSSFAARLTPEQLGDAAIKGTAAFVSKGPSQ